MFYVKIAARPDARMVEVPLEVETELPREFDGQAVLASSGVPRKIKLRAARDSLKLSTAYRADVLLGDIVKLAIRGSPTDVARVQEAAQKFVRLVRERRPDGASLTVNSNGRGKIDIVEAGIGAATATRPPPPAAGRTTPGGGSVALRTSDPAAAADKLAALERRVSQLESALPQLLEAGDGQGGNTIAEPRLQFLEDKLRAADAHRVVLEQKLESVHGELRAAEAESVTRVGALQRRLDSTLRAIEERLTEARSDAVWRGEVAPPPTRAPDGKLLGPLLEGDGRRQTRRTTAVDAFADGLRGELRSRIGAVLKASAPALEKADRAAALGAEGALSLGVPGTISGELRAISAQAAARQQALQRIGDEVDFYAAPDLPVASLLVDRLEKQQITPDPVELVRRALAAAGGNGPVDTGALSSWLARAAAICGDELVQALPGEVVLPELHDAAPGSEPRGTVVRTAAPGVRRNNGQVLRRPLVESSEKSPEPPKPAPPAAAAPAVQTDDGPVIEVEEVGAVVDLDEGEVLEELEPIGTGPISAPAEVTAPPAGEPAAAVAAASDGAVPPPSEPPAAPAPPVAAKSGGDLWSDVSSDSAWESITLGAPVVLEHPSDPWGSPAKPAPKPPEGNEPAKS